VPQLEREFVDRLSDVLDVAVISVLIYVGIGWLRERATRSITLCALLLIALYGLARSLNMYMTSMLFNVGFTALLLAWIVVFQQDIRRAFERLANWDFAFRSRRRMTDDQRIDLLVETVNLLARSRVGALVVLEGREPLERLVRGGVPVDGELSSPLLCSIFQPQSPAHDGAVILHNWRIARLGVHLPLTRNPAALGERGTRHAAALGLAEQCDATVVVVSEERGTIGIAHNGMLRQVDADHLRSELEALGDGELLRGDGPTRLRPLVHNLGAKLLSVALAIGIWFLAGYRMETVQRTFILPVEYRNLPTGFAVQETWPTRIEATLAGTERSIQLLDPESLVVSFDLENARSGRMYVLNTREGLSLPPEVTIARLEPEQIVVTIRGAPDSSRR
jgi:uncharacterized protein (TIGR00159 family)